MEETIEQMEYLYLLTGKQMCFCTIIFPIILLRMHSRFRTTVLEQCNPRGSVAVNEGTHNTNLVYCDPFYELVLYSY